MQPSLPATGDLIPIERFSAELWSGSEDTFRAILEHPFITGLTDGSLERSAFEFYVIQDAHYLREYARALSVAAARAPVEADIAMFNEHAAGAIAVERSLHEDFFADFAGLRAGGASVTAITSMISTTTGSPGFKGGARCGAGRTNESSSSSSSSSS